MWHGLPARENTAKMAVPLIKQLRLNTYPAKAGVQNEKPGFPLEFIPHTMRGGNDKCGNIRF